MTGDLDRGKQFAYSNEAAEHPGFAAIAEHLTDSWRAVMDGHCPLHPDEPLERWERGWLRGGEFHATAAPHLVCTASGFDFHATPEPRFSVGLIADL